MGALSKTGISALLILSSLAAQSGSDPVEKAKYSAILDNHPDVPEVKFNAGYEAFQNRELDRAQNQFKSSVESGNQNLLFPSLYNLGNTLYSKAEQGANAPSEVQQGQPPSYAEAVDAYRKALTLYAGNENAKHNYELALKRMLEQPPQQQEQQQQQDQSEDNSEDQENQDQQQSQEDQKDQQEQQKSQEQQKDSAEEKQEEQQSSPQEMNQTEQKPDSEAILDALRAQEKLRPKLFVDKMKSKKPEKDW